MCVGVEVRTTCGSHSARPRHGSQGLNLGIRLGGKCLFLPIHLNGPIATFYWVLRTCSFKLLEKVFKFLKMITLVAFTDSFVLALWP